MSEPKTISVWRFEDAPANFAGLSRSGGDEDWVVFIPLAYGPIDYIPWLEHIDTCREPERHEVSGGTVFIGSHA